MADDLTNIPDPLNTSHNLKTPNAPHVTRLPPEAQADDLFDGSPTTDPTIPEDPANPAAPTPAPSPAKSPNFPKSPRHNP